MIMAIAVDRTASDILHYEVRQPLRRRSAIENLGDVGVFKIGQDLPFLTKPADDLLGVHAVPEDLDRHSLLEDVIGPLRQIDGTHSATTDGSHDSVRADPASRRHCRFLVASRRRGACR